MSKIKYALDTKEKIQLGGVTQSIRIRSTDPNLPVLLFLHGGPGVCDRHWVLGDQSGLAEVATMVCWDQRGAGLSYDKKAPLSVMTVSRMVEDAAELVEYLCKRFDKEKVIVVGHSWGSLLGTLLVHRHPEHIAAYIGMGQYVEGDRNEQISYDFVMNVAKERGDKKALADLERIGAPVNGHYRSIADLQVQRDYMTKYGGGGYKESGSLITSLVIPLILTPEYRLWDLIGYTNGAYASLDALWDEVVDADLISEVKSLAVPVYLTEGRHDQNTPPVLAQEWFDNLEAPYKEWIWFEESAHSPIKEEPELWGKTVRRIIGELS